jgi:hypothetical protein
MTGFGLYLVILNIIGVLLNFYYAGRGGVNHTPTTLVIAGIWAALNTLGIIFLGTGLGI